MGWVAGGHTRYNDDRVVVGIDPSFACVPLVVWVFESDDLVSLHIFDPGKSDTIYPAESSNGFWIILGEGHLSNLIGGNAIGISRNDCPGTHDMT